MNRKITSIPTPRRDPAKTGTIRELNPPILLLIHLTKGSKTLQSGHFDGKVIRFVTLEWTC
jgi:hypothetical protein